MSQSKEYEPLPSTPEGRIIIKVPLDGTVVTTTIVDCVFMAAGLIDFQRFRVTESFGTYGEGTQPVETRSAWLEERKQTEYTPNTNLAGLGGTAISGALAS